jgi:DnaJ-class molecular chaperone
MALEICPNCEGKGGRIFKFDTTGDYFKKCGKCDGKGFIEIPDTE